MPCTSAREKLHRITKEEARQITTASGKDMQVLPLLTGTVPDTVIWSRHLRLNKNKVSGKIVWIVTYIDNGRDYIYPVKTLPRAINFIQSKGYKDDESYSFQSAGRSSVKTIA
jgi:hypothetical protein